MKLKAFVLDATYFPTDRGTLNIILGKLEDGSKAYFIERSIQPYFYIDFNDADKTVEKMQLTGLLKSYEFSEKKLIFEKRSFIKAFASKPSDLSRLRDSIKHQPIINECYEYNLNQYKRFLRDRKISPAATYMFEVVESEEVLEDFPEYPVFEIKEVYEQQEVLPEKFRMMAFDIEYVDDTVVHISISEKPYAALVFALGDAEGADRTYSTEKELIQGFLTYISEKDPDFLFAYNSDEFDFDILAEKIKKLKIKAGSKERSIFLKRLRRGRTYAARTEGIVHLDLFQFVQNILAPQLQSEILTLNSVASEIVGEGKEEIGYEKIIDLWRRGPRKELVEYSRNDAVITYLLGEKLLHQVLALSMISGETPFDACRETFGLLVDNYLVKKTVYFDLVAPNLPKQEEINERRRKPPYTGGYVIEPAAGLHENIAVFDFRSLYPSIIISFNISPETLNCACCRDSEDRVKVPELDYYFCSKHRGFIPACLEEVLKRRFELKEELKRAGISESARKYLNEMQIALKILANASYGYLAYAGARWYSRECAESAAAFGRYFIKQAIKVAEEYGEVIYGDTDSLFLKISDESAIEDFLTRINSSLPGILELDFQGIYKKGLFSLTREKRAAKKRYALLSEDGKMIIRGFEAVRKDWCDLAKDLQRKVLVLSMNGEINEAIKEVKDVVKNLKERKIKPADLSMVAQLGKELEDYRVKTPHAVAAKRLIDRGYDISRGEQIRYVIVKGEGSIADRAEALEFVSEKDYDVDYYLEHQIFPAALRVMEALGYGKIDFDNSPENNSGSQGRLF